MKDLYKLVNISKQAIYQSKQAAQTNLLLADALVEQIIKLRIKHQLFSRQISREQRHQILSNNEQIKYTRLCKKLTHAVLLKMYQEVFQNHLLEATKPVSKG